MIKVRRVNPLLSFSQIKTLIFDAIDVSSCYYLVKGVLLTSLPRLDACEPTPLDLLEYRCWPVTATNRALVLQPSTTLDLSRCFFSIAPSRTGGQAGPGTAGRTQACGLDPPWMHPYL